MNLSSPPTQTSTKLLCESTFSENTDKPFRYNLRFPTCDLTTGIFCLQSVMGHTDDVEHFEMLLLYLLFWC